MFSDFEYGPNHFPGNGNFGDSTISYFQRNGCAHHRHCRSGLTETIASEPVTLIVNETVCVGVSTPAEQCPAANTVTLDNSNAPSLVIEVPYATFAPVWEVTVLKDIYFASDGSTGNGQIHGVSNTYPTPELAAWVLSLCGLAAIWLAQRRVMRVRKL
jgi:hypothetical protein